MRVTLAIDALSPTLSGIGRYCWELTQRLPGCDGISEVQFFRDGRLHRDPRHFVEPTQTRSGRAVAAWLGRRQVFRRLTRTRIAKGIFHSPNYFLPGIVETGLITVHDLSVLKYPETHPAARIRHFEREFESSIKRASFILTDTEAVRSEVIAELGIAPDRVRSIHLGVDARYRPRSEESITQFLHSAGLSYQGYGLCVSTLEPRKRVDTLIRAWSILPRAVRDKYPLVLAGQNGWLNERLDPQLNAAIDEGWVRWLGFVDEQDLPLLYAGAGTFAYPSIYEGFGLPPLEAMASGIPVVVAQGPCLSEVCGPAASYVNPEDELYFAQILERTLTDQAWRASAVAAGLSRAAEFAWDKCVHQTANIYAEASKLISGSGT